MHIDDVIDYSEAAEYARSLDMIMSSDGFRSPGSPIPLRPVLMAPDRYEDMVRTAQRVMRLLREVAFSRAGDYRDLARAVDFEYPPVSLWSDSPVQNRWASAMARPDIGMANGVPKVFEVNVNSALGGMTQLSRLDRAFLRRADLREVWREHPVSTNGVASALSRLLCAVGDSMDRRVPHVGIVGFRHDEDKGGSEETYIDLIDELRTHGIPAVYVPAQDVRVRHGKAYAGRVRLDILLRMFVSADAPAAGIDIEPLQRVIAEDAAVVLSPEAAGPLASKRILAWITEAADRMSAQDRAFVERHIPETHIVEAPGTLGSSRRAVRERLLREQHDLLLKGNQGHSAHTVTVGRECTESEWLSLVDEALGSRDHVVQRRIETDLLPIPVYSDVHERVMRPESRVVYGPLLIGERCGGILVRHSDSGLGDVVSGITGGVANTTFRMHTPE
ncbi:hypothetical protein [Nocardiopsis sp. ATB16-24]|uniref:hypothetical protein n=1 Tax=Nocardiopsis sp. ATB16-24 TaxID=3019555 RepID=UPI002552F010|nr:hypothetical protein [Nocardiopsis sp. ATB16-24]